MNSKVHHQSQLLQRNRFKIKGVKKEKKKKKTASALWHYDGSLFKQSAAETSVLSSVFCSAYLAVVPKKALSNAWQLVDVNSTGKRALQHFPTFKRRGHLHHELSSHERSNPGLGCLNWALQLPPVVL